VSLRHPRFFALLLVLGASASVLAQSGNLLKNSGAEEGAQHWRPYGDAKVEGCEPGNPCFVLRQGGYFIQNAVIPEEAAGQYALLVGRASFEGDASRGYPYLYGYMMNAGGPSFGRIYSYLSGQQMSGSSESSAKWQTLWGVFKIKPGTATLAFFLRTANIGGKTGNGVTKFDDLALYIFPTEESARAAALNGPMTTQSTAQKSQTSKCTLSRKELSSIHRVRLDMSSAAVAAQFPGSKLRQQSGDRVSILLIDAIPVSNQDLRDVKRVYARFYEDRLFLVQVEYLAPQFKNVDEFIRESGVPLGLPAAENWEDVDGIATNSKYILCDGAEVRFYAAPANSENLNNISLVDTRIEKRLQDDYRSKQNAKQ
jgi:hypothetical protein